MSDSTSVLDEVRQRLNTAQGELDSLIEDRETAIAEFEKIEEPTDEQNREFDEAGLDFRAKSEVLRKDISAFEGRVSDLEGVEKRRQEASTVTVSDRAQIREPHVYRQDNANEISYYKDLLVTSPLSRDLAPRGAAERMERHAKQGEERMEAAATRERREAEVGVEEAEREFRQSMGIRGSLEESPFEQRVNPSRETGKGGEFVPPLWLVEDDFIPQLRAGRTIPGLCRNMPVPPGTDTIKLPKVKVGTEVAPQLMDNAGVASRDIETTYVEAAVKTLAGQEDVAIQLIEQSPGQVFDRVVQEDLVADYNLQVARNVSYGQGTNYTTLNAGTIKGLFPVANWAAGHRKSTKTLAEAPAAPLVGLNANWSFIAKERFDTNDVYHVINPAFGAYLSSLQDGKESKEGRFLLEASSIPSFNAGAITPPVNPAEGYYGMTPLGVPIYISANIPPILPQATSTEAAASILAAADKESEKLITSGTEAFSYGLTFKGNDVWFFESELRTRVLPEVLSGTLQIRFQVYAYVSLLVRYSPSVQFCGGTPWKVGTSFAAAPSEPTLAGYAF